MTAVIICFACKTINIISALIEGEWVMKTQGKWLSLVLSLIMVLSLLPITARAGNVSATYIDADGAVQTVTATQVTASTGTLYSGWYVVEGPDPMTRSGTITISGDAKLILADGASLTVAGSNWNAGINVSPGKSLEIYGQELGTGALNATGGPDGAGIGGGDWSAGGTVAIYGGTVTANGGNDGAGIGGGWMGNGGTVAIYGGTVTANGGNDGAGIGSGYHASGGTVTISGGMVTARGGDASAGIGGGIIGNGGNVVISGGVVTANGGNDGAGIGSGWAADGVNVVISGGTVAATGGDGGAGIGGGSAGDGGNVAISGGTIKAAGTGYGASSIGGGWAGSGGTLTNGSGSNVYLTTVTLQNSGIPVALSNVVFLSTGAGSTYYPYGANGVKTNASGKLYLYLPSGTSTMAAKTTAPLKYSGTVTANTSAGVLLPDTQPPVVTVVAPSSLYAPLDSNVVITFDEETIAGFGTVSISTDGVTYTELPGGSWSAGNTIYTAPYSGLPNRTQYTVKVEGFKDFNNNTMSGAETSHTFRTTPPVYSITYALGGGSVSTPNPTSYTDESPNMTLNNPTRAGYTFTGWSGTDIAGDPTMNVTILLGSTGSRSFTAHWVANIYALSFDSQNGSAEVDISVIYDSAVGALPTPVRTGYSFEGWYTDEDGLGTRYDAATVYLTAGNRTLYADWTANTYALSLNSQNGSAEGSISVIYDSAVGALPTPVRTSYSFEGWNIQPNGSGMQYTATTVYQTAGNLTLYAIWAYIPPPDPSYSAKVSTGSGEDTTLPISVNNSSGSASVEAGEQGLSSDGTVIAMPTIPGVNAYMVKIPVPALSTANNQGTLTLSTGVGSVIIPSNMLMGVADITGGQAEITISEGDKNGLPESVKSAIGNMPLIQLTLTINGRQSGWSNPDAPVTVRIPYTPTETELNSPESIVIWYIDGSGNIVTIPNGCYNPATGMVTFTTTHFSDYAVAYSKVSFNDVASDAWFHKAVQFIAARGITDGTGEEKFNPDAMLTRGQFLVMLMKAYGIAPDEKPKDNFTDAGDTYYTGYLAAAKQLGIAAGVGNNMYAPGKEITRQEMFTLLYSALTVIKALPKGDSDKMLSSFSDAGQISSWAKEPMLFLVKNGVIGGNAGKLNPVGTSTRAEMAQVLYNLLTR